MIPRCEESPTLRDDLCFILVFEQVVMERGSKGGFVVRIIKNHVNPVNQWVLERRERSVNKNEGAGCKSFPGAMVTLVARWV
mmetsp:Transcript_12967/g.30596  ORF Transcript_12967/g.30596 Transcript_12967/m.30596 type:complete len:82 (+) Transcript_12967:226-471(+)